MIDRMFAKLLSLLTTVKGVAAATLIAGATVGTGVLVVDPAARDAIGTAVQNISSPTSSQLKEAEGSARSSGRPSASPSGQPAIVAARNSADQDLRRAFQDDQQALEKLRGTRVDGPDREKLNDVIRTADEKLRERLTRSPSDAKGRKRAHRRVRARGRAGRRTCARASRRRRKRRSTRS